MLFSQPLFQLSPRLIEVGYSLKEFLCVLVEVVGVVFGVGVEVVLRAEVPVAAVPAVVAVPAVSTTVVAAAVIAVSAVEASVPAVTVATVVSAIPAVKAVPAVSATVVASAWTTLRLYVAFRLRSEGAHRESHLACLGIDLKEFHVNFLTNCKDILYILCLVPSDL